MPMTDFFQVFRKLAGSELRTVTVPPGRGGSLPPDLYAFIELYCDEPDCDCRRVTLAVIAESKRRLVAHINLGFDSADEMAGPFLDPLNVQASFAPALLEFFTDMINRDPAYLGRLHRHYVMFKEHCEGRRYAGSAFEKPGRVKRVALAEAPGFPSDVFPQQRAVAPPVRGGGKVGRNDPCPCGSGKKFKQCCLSNPAPKSLGTATPVASTVGRDPLPAPTDPRALADAARQLIAAVLAWRRNPRHQTPWDPDVQRALETNHELAPTLLRLLLNDYAPDGRQQTPTADYGACLALLDESLTQVRYSVERERPWAIALAEQIQQDIAQWAFKPEVDVRVQQDLIAALHESKLELHPCIRDQAASLGAYYARFSGSKGVGDLDGLLERLAQDTATTDPFEMLEPLLAQMAVMPAEGQAMMAIGMMASKQPLMNELGVLLLLHPDAAVRTQLPEAYRLTPGVRRIGPLGLRRLIGLRNWLPAPERPAVDALIKAVRLAGVASAPLPPERLLSVYASSFDGSGAQAVWTFAKDKRRYRITALLVKQGVGIREVWGEGGLAKREMDAKIKEMNRAGGAVPVTGDYLERLAAHFIAVGLDQQTPPPAQLLGLNELAGGDYWKPESLVPATAIADLAATDPDAFNPERVRQVLAQARAWPGSYDFAVSWFEDDAHIDDLLRREVGPPAHWLRRLPDAATAIVDRLLEARRGRWAERLLWMALWADACAGRAPVAWQDFLIVAQALEQGTSLKQIPLMQAIAERSVQSAAGRAQLR